MKKFLSILLALAVGFTFTFGSAMSAFAVTGSTYTYEQAYKLLDDTAKELKDSAKISMDTAVSTYNEATVTAAGTTPSSILVGDILYHTTNNKWYTVIADGAPADIDTQVYLSFATSHTSTFITAPAINVSKDAAKELFKDIYDDYCKAIDNEVKAQKDALDALYAAGTTEFKDGTTATTGSVSETFSTADLAAITAPSYNVAVGTPEEKLAALKAEFKVVKANQLADLAAINTAAYSTTKANGASETPAETAVRLVAQATAQVNGITVGTGDDINAIAAKITNVKKIYVKGEGIAKATGALASGGKVDLYDYESGINGLAKTADEVKDNAKLDYAKTKAVDSLTGQINSAMKATIDILEADILAEKLKANPDKKVIAAKEAQIEDAKADYAGILEVAKYYVENQKTVSALATFAGNTFTAVVPQYDDTGLYTGSGSTKKNNSYCKNRRKILWQLYKSQYDRYG